MPSILFVCTANRFRSPLAAALLGKTLSNAGMHDFGRIASAGTWARPGEPVMPGVCEVAAKYGLDLSLHRSTRVSAELLSGYDLILVMQGGQREALVTEYPHLREHVYLLSDVTERRIYDIPDAPGSIQEMSELVSELAALIERGMEFICVLATYLHNTKQLSRLQYG